MKRAGSAALFKSGWMALAVIMLAAVFLWINWYYYQRTKLSLDEDFGFRLRTLASLVASSVDPDNIPLLVPYDLEHDTDEKLVSTLLEISTDHSLSNILIVREDGITLFSLQPGIFPTGEVYPHWNMDYPAIIGALEGTPTATALYRALDGTYLKAGYAPVPLDAAHAVAFVAVEANVDFLHGLNELRNILILATAISIIGIVLFIWFVEKATGSLIRVQESLMRAETLSSMGRMAAGIAHEIRNPLFIIRSSAEKLKASHPDEADEIDGFIIEEVDRLNNTLTDYLLFSRNEPAPWHPLDLATTLRRSIRLVENSGEKGSITFETRFGIEKAPFIGEEKKLQQTFLNILLNARQAIQDAGVITISIHVNDKYYIIRFDDTGAGIPERELEKIFEPFYTNKPGGSGLGLPIVKRIIEDHGGSVLVQSREGAGTSVTITLPVKNISRGDRDEQDTHRR